MIIIGIDPGMNGAVARLEFREKKIMAITTYNFNDCTTQDLLETLDGACFHLPSEDIFAYVEAVQALPGFMRGGIANFKMGKSIGNIEMALSALRVPHEFVRAAVWQTHLHCLAKGKKYTKHKNEMKAKAQQLFPSIKCTHANSDALLIAEYGRHKRYLEIAK